MAWNRSVVSLIRAAPSSGQVSWFVYQPRVSPRMHGELVCEPDPSALILISHSRWWWQAALREIQKQPRDRLPRPCYIQSSCHANRPSCELDMHVSCQVLKAKCFALKHLLKSLSVPQLHLFYTTDLIGMILQALSSSRILSCMQSYLHVKQTFAQV